MSVLTESRLGSVGLSSPCGSPQSQPYGMQLDLDNLAEDVLKSDEFKMYLYKVLPCDKREQHDTGSCPFAHPGEKAARRDLRVHKYDSVACPEVLQSGRCPKGNSCTMAHSVFEYWLHPQRYRTQMCRDGPACNRKVCFFAHCEQQLRHVPGTAADTADPFSKAKFSLSGMKRQKSCSTSQASPGALYRPNGILEPAGSSSIRPLFQPGLQAWDAAAAVAGGYNLSSTVGQRRGSLDSHFYSNNLMPGSSIDRVGSSRKSNMDECTSGISGKSCFERLVLGGGAADAALVGNSPPALHYRALGSPASIQNNLAASAGGTGTETSFRHWVPNGCTLPTATAACHVQPTTACNSYNPVDPNAYLEVLSVYQQQAESCRMQAALAEAAATEAAGQLQALVAALGVPDSSSSMLAQPVNLGCSLSSGPICNNLEPALQQGLTPAVNGSVLDSAGLTARLGACTAVLAQPSSLAVSGPGLSNVACPGYQAVPGLAAGSLMLPATATQGLLAATTGMGPLGLLTGSAPLGQVHSTLL